MAAKASNSALWAGERVSSYAYIRNFAVLTLRDLGIYTSCRTNFYSVPTRVNTAPLNSSGISSAAPTPPSPVSNFS